MKNIKEVRTLTKHYETFNKMTEEGFSYSDKIGEFIGMFRFLKETMNFIEKGVEEKMRAGESEFSITVNPPFSENLYEEFYKNLKIIVTSYGYSFFKKPDYENVYTVDWTLDRTPTQLFNINHILDELDSSTASFESMEEEIQGKINLLEIYKNDKLNFGEELNAVKEATEDVNDIVSKIKTHFETVCKNLSLDEKGVLITKTGK